MSLYVTSYILQQILYSVTSKVADRDEVRECHNALPGQGHSTIQKAVTNDNAY